MNKKLFSFILYFFLCSCSGWERAANNMFESIEKLDGQNRKYCTVENKSEYSILVKCYYENGNTTSWYTLEKNDSEAFKPFHKGHYGRPHVAVSVSLGENFGIIFQKLRLDEGEKVIVNNESFTHFWINDGGLVGSNTYKYGETGYDIIP